VTSTALLNRNNALSIVSQRTEELQDECALTIAAIRTQCFRAREHINQLEWMIGEARRMMEVTIRMGEVALLMMEASECGYFSVIAKRRSANFIANYPKCRKRRRETNLT
jgi:hypothetical protein